MRNLMVGVLVMSTACGQVIAPEEDVVVPEPEVSEPGWDARMCPASYTITLGGTSRYRFAYTAATAWDHSDLCAADTIGMTHLVSLTDTDELSALQQALALSDSWPRDEYPASPVMVYVGGVQLPSQFETFTGWINVTGGDLLDAWAANEPSDYSGGGGEVHEEQFAAMQAETPVRAQVFDIFGPSLRGAVCECDGIPMSGGARFAVNSARR